MLELGRSRYPLPILYDPVMNIRLALLTLLIPLAVVGGGGGCSHGPTDHPYHLQHEYSVADPQFRRTMGSLLGPPIVEGNSVSTLVNGEQFFPAMLQAIASAQKTIDIETYVYSTGEVGQKFAKALAERAQHGVKVHVIVDGVGRDPTILSYVTQIKEACGEVIEYHPLHWFALTAAQHRNNRTHRKLLIVDGTVGFTGGAGVSDHWLGNGDSPKHFRDTHYMVKGPAVAQIQAAFLDNWMETTGQVLAGEDYFPPLDKCGDQSAQVFKSSPDNGSESMELLYLLSIAAAQKNIRLATAYFVPDHIAIQALLDARKRGVTVQILVPGKHIDVKPVRPASRARWGEMLQAGVQIYEYQPTMYHVKQMIVDDQWVSIGSANLDNLSFKLNDEANLNVLDHAFAQEQIHLFEDDLRHSQPITYNQWQHRPFPERLIEGLTTLFGFVM
jgi:cardiolipin synthase